MQLSEKQTKLAAGALVALVLVVVYFLWARNSTPSVQEIPGQSVANPFGVGAPQGAGKGAQPGAANGVMPAPINRPGVPDPVYGPGPSGSAPIPGTR